jgi:hypothetical protein
VKVCGVAAALVRLGLVMKAVFHFVLYAHFLNFIECASKSAEHRALGSGLLHAVFKPVIITVRNACERTCSDVLKTKIDVQKL